LHIITIQNDIWDVKVSKGFYIFNLEFCSQDNDSVAALFKTLKVDKRVIAVNMGKGNAMPPIAEKVLNSLDKTRKERIVIDYLAMLSYVDKPYP